MNVTQSLQKIILSVIILGFVGFIAYNTIFGEIDITQADVDMPVPEAVGQDILILSDKLKTLKIETDIFSKPLFTNLIDTRAIIIEEPTGRPNPFSAVGNDTASPGRAR